MMKYDMVVNEDKDTFLIRINEAEYQNIVIKVGNLAFDENNSVEFDMELPEGHTELYDNEEFCNNVSEIVGDILKKAVNMFWGGCTEEAMTALEEKAKKAFENENVQLPDGKSFLQTFGEKGYVFMEEDDETVSVVHIKSGKKYYLDKPEQMNFIKNEIFGSGIILHV